MKAERCQQEENIIRRIRHEGIGPGTIRAFRNHIIAYYKKSGRVLPWRRDINAYRVLVSEIMLQQTQVDRVIEKYRLFIRLFPNFKVLATASLPQVLAAWSGLGYNRRALALQKTARIVLEKYHGRLPNDPETLVTLPGIGPATAASIAVFAFNEPTAFIETNIRTVFLHFFFSGTRRVPDDKLRPLVAKSIDQTHPREWYSALMDYGTMLKKQYSNPGRRSLHHAKQNRFKGSNRQIRGMVLKLLLGKASFNIGQLAEKAQRPQSKVREILKQMEKEGFVLFKRKRVSLTKTLKNSWSY